MGKAFLKINVTLRLLLVSSVYLIRSMMQKKMTPCTSIENIQILYIIVD